MVCVPGTFPLSRGPRFTSFTFGAMVTGLGARTTISSSSAPMFSISSRVQVAMMFLGQETEHVRCTVHKSSDASNNSSATTVPRRNYGHTPPCMGPSPRPYLPPFLPLDSPESHHLAPSFLLQLFRNQWVVVVLGREGNVLFSNPEEEISIPLKTKLCVSDLV